MNVMISVDDGAFQDWRTARLLRKYNHRATFYWTKKNPKHEIMSEDSMIEFVNEYPEMEIGQHTYSHKLLTRVSKKEASDEINLGYLWHKETFGDAPTTFCYPRGYMTPELAGMVKDRGYLGARAVKGNNNIYTLDGGLHIHPKNMKEIRTSREIRSMWFHSWEIQRYGMWDFLETLLSAIKGRGITVQEYVFTHSN